MIRFHRRILAMSVLLAATSSADAQNAQRTFRPTIPKTWVDDEMASLEIPLANPAGSPKHISADYYYRIPVLPIYKPYTWYAPGQEPPGYLESLKQHEPEIIWGEDKNGQKYQPGRQRSGTSDQQHRVLISRALRCSWRNLPS